MTVLSQQQGAAAQGKGEGEAEGGASQPQWYAGEAQLFRIVATYEAALRAQSRPQVLERVCAPGLGSRVCVACKAHSVLYACVQHGRLLLRCRLRAPTAFDRHVK